MSEPFIGIYSHLVTDEIYDPDGTLRVRAVGGAGAYAAVGASLVSGPFSAALVCGVGRLDRPCVERWLAEREVDASGLFTVSDRSPVTEVRYHADGEREEGSRYGDAHFDACAPTPARSPIPLERMNALYVFRDLDQILWNEVGNSRAYLDGPLLWELHAGVCEPERLDAVRQVAEIADIVSLNLTEILRLTGETNPPSALRALGVRSLVALRMGADGALIHDRGETLAVAAAQDPVVDPTGGGNSWSGAFLAAFAQSGDPLSAGRLAAAVAARVIGEVGAPLVSDPVREDVRRAALNIPTRTHRRSSPCGTRPSPMTPTRWRRTCLAGDL